MQLKLRYKSFVSSLKKAILKLKEKGVLCIKRSKPTIPTYNKITTESIKETATGSRISVNNINIFLSVLDNLLKKEKNNYRMLLPVQLKYKQNELEENWAIGTNLFSALSKPQKNQESCEIYLEVY
ncbi:MAG: hypothetical protein ACEPOV_04815 [Hyphomicrobiales bacterium]